MRPEEAQRWWGRALGRLQEPQTSLRQAALKVTGGAGVLSARAGPFHHRAIWSSPAGGCLEPGLEGRVLLRPLLLPWDSAERERERERESGHRRGTALPPGLAGHRHPDLGVDPECLGDGPRPGPGGKGQRPDPGPPGPPECPRPLPVGSPVVPTGRQPRLPRLASAAQESRSPPAGHSGFHSKGLGCLPAGEGGRN